MSAHHYADFLEEKAQFSSSFGFEADEMPSFMFEFQKFLTAFALKKGRAAVIADCGLGKTIIQLVWGDQMAHRTNKPTLLITPLAVTNQTVREAEKFHVECKRSEKISGASIIVTNYERLHHFNRNNFGAVICDESSAIKSFDGVRRAQVTEFLRTVPYRLLCTATAAPNDYVELGTSSEALGEMGYMDMLSRFFKNDQHSSHPNRKWAGGAKWRFKGHAETPFWKWVCSWARACRKPSDLGFSDDGFVLPPLIQVEHVVEARKLAPGFLFSMPARNMFEEREERRRTIQERCEKAADLVANTGKPAVIWCHLNEEGDLLAEMIKDSRQVSGNTPDEEREEIYEDFSTWKLRVLIIKPKVGAWGLNWQHCAHVVTFATHSYEQFYQAVRRCWRFGQKDPVRVDLILTEGEQNVKENLQRKSDSADRMFSELVAHMNDALKIDRQTAFTKIIEAPRWL